MADVTLPQLGETVTEGTITRWFKQVGDAVAADEPLFEVSTDKVDTEVPSPVAGTLAEIRAQEGDTVPVGAVIAVVGDEADAAAAPAAPGGATPAAAAPEPETAPVAAEPEAAPVAAEPEAAPAQEPALAPAAPAESEPASAAPPESEREPATVETESAAEPEFDAEQAVPQRTDAAAADAAPTPPADGVPSDNRLLSPVVRRLVGEHGIDPSSITGTGPGGRITRDDVLNHIDKLGTSPAPAAAVAPAPAPAAPAAPPAAPPAASATAPAVPSATAAKPAVAAGERDSTVKLTKIRRLTGQHMLMSKSVTPHAFSVVEVDYANVDVTRNAVKGEWKQSEGFSLTYLPFITRAVVDAIADFPHMNASLGANEIVVHNFVDIGIAVDLDHQGLIVPVIRAAETKRLRAIAREISDLAARAHGKKLSPDEISGGTFTISNNGSAGSVLTMPIINQPQVAILSTDAIVRKPVVANLPDGGEAIVIHPVGKLAMAWDHRVFDGAYAAAFLVRIKQDLETRDWSAEL